jgi:hypothetical protein
MVVMAISAKPAKERLSTPTAGGGNTYKKSISVIEVV